MGVEIISTYTLKRHNKLELIMNSRMAHENEKEERERDREKIYNLLTSSPVITQKVYFVYRASF